MFKKILFALTALLCMSVTALAQNVRGTVVDELGEPLIGVSVKVKGGSAKAITDMNGKFEMKDAAGKTLEFSYIGYEKTSVKASDNMKVKLNPQNTQIDEVIVTGVQVMDKRTFTGASTKVDADKIKLSGIADVSRGLEGRVAGVQVTNVSGTFGAAPKIRVRGATSIYGSSKPLWVIDGVIWEDNIDVSADELSSGDAKTIISSAVAGLNSDDIESFTILKDGSATSIYGARAMAGVIVITTKKGKQGRASVGYMGEFTTRFKPSYNDYNIMNSQEIMGVYREMEDKGFLKLESMSSGSDTGIYGYLFQQLRKYDASTGQYGLPNTQSARNAYLQAAEFRNTDWFDLLFSSNVMQNHSVSISGGTEKMRNYFSMSLMDDPGQYVNRGMVRRYTFNGNTSYDILKNLTVKLAAQGSHRDQETPGSLNRTIDVVSGQVRRDFDINPFSFALNSSRCLDPNINYTRFYSPFNIFNELEQNYNEIDMNDLMFRAELEYKPISSLTLNGLISTRMSSTKRVQNVMDDSNQANAYRAGTDATDDNSTIRDSNRLLYTDPDNELALPESVLPEGGIKYQYDDKMRSYYYRLTANYRDVIAKHHTINILAGSELSTVRRVASTWTGWGYMYKNGGIVHTPYLWLKQYNEENTDYFSEGYTQTNTLAFYANAVYTFRDRYTINGTLRYEGTNRLGKATSSRWLPTWNVSGAYDMWSEKWMEKTHKWLSGLKFRVSYSLTADTGPSWVTNATAIYKTKNVWRPDNSSAENMIYLSQIANNELTFEKKHELNFGIDFGFLNDRIGVTFDIYRRNQFDLIGQTYTQGGGGVISKMANVADMSSDGIELGLSTVNIKNRNFQWTSDFIFSKSETKITNLKTDGRAIDLVTAAGYGVEGYPVRALFSYKFAGLNSEGLPRVYDEAGEINLGDVNFQETENLTDFLVYEGSIDPTFYGSLNNTFTYTFKKAGKLALDIYITYAGGNKVRLDPNFSSRYSDLTAFPREFKNRWMVAGDEKVTDIPTIASLNQIDRYGSNTLSTAYNAYNYSTARVADGTFIRLKEVALTYTLPKEWMDKSKFLSGASIKVATTNPCLLYADKKLNGQDPEFINAGGVASPIQKQCTATLRLNF